MAGSRPIYALTSGRCYTALSKSRFIRGGTALAGAGRSGGDATSASLATTTAASANLLTAKKFRRSALGPSIIFCRRRRWSPGVLRFFLRQHRETVESLATIVAINAFDFVFMPAFCAGKLFALTQWLSSCSRFFFGLVAGVEVDVCFVVDSLPIAAFSPVAAGDSFFAAS